MEKVQADVGHVVRALEAIWNEVGYWARSGGSRWTS